LQVDFRIDFYQKYIYIYISVYTFVPRLCLFPSFTFGPRRRSPAQRSSLTYGYSNDQGILDGSDMESLDRRCSPSESIVSILCPPARRLRSHEIFPLTQSSGLSSRICLLLSLSPPRKFLPRIVDADAIIKRRSVSNGHQSLCDLLLSRILGTDLRNLCSSKNSI